jgi:two-component system, LytTR family, response regulator
MKAIIVDDEKHCSETLAVLLKKYCLAVHDITECNHPIEAIEIIKSVKPDIVFLDIEMPVMNGFELLENLPSTNLEIIFTTSYDQYAIKAIKFSALDYLLKPVDKDELQSAVQKAEKKLSHPAVNQIELLLQKMRNPHTINRIALPTMEGLQLVAVDSIISCSADSNYTVFFLKENQKLVVSKTLKETEELLEDHSFLRVHHSHIINLNEAVKYIKGEGGYLLMSNGTTIDVSRTRKENLIKKLQPSKA